MIIMIPTIQCIDDEFVILDFRGEFEIIIQCCIVECFDIVSNHLYFLRDFNKFYKRKKNK